MRPIHSGGRFRAALVSRRSPPAGLPAAASADTGLPAAGRRR